MVRIYAALCVVGTVVPLYFLASFVSAARSRIEVSPTPV